MKAREIMVQPVVTVLEDANLEEVARIFLDRHIGGVPVVDREGRIRGVITESDFLAKEKGIPFSTFRWPQVLGQWLPREGIERIYQAARTMTAREIMTTDPITAREDDRLEELLERMLRYDVHRIPIVRYDVPVGMVTRQDIMRIMLRDEKDGSGGQRDDGRP